MGIFDDIGNFFTGAQDNQAFNQYKGLQEGMIGATQKGTKPWLDNPAYQVAPLNEFQLQFGQGAQGLLGDGSSGSYSGQMARLFDGLDTEVTMADIMGFAAPLSDTLNERGQNQLDQSYSRSSADISNRQAASAAFSGSGSAAALERAALNDSMTTATRDMAMGNEASAYQLGSGLATGNSDRALQGLGTQINGLNAADAARLAGLGFDAEALGLLGAYGDRNQQQRQSEMDAPYTTTSRLLGLLSGNVPQEEASAFQALLGTVLGSAQGVAQAGKDIGWWGGK